MTIVACDAWKACHSAIVGLAGIAIDDKTFHATRSEMHALRVYSLPEEPLLNAVADIHARLLELADRLLVIADGKIVFEVKASEADRTVIGHYMAGQMAGQTAGQHANR